MHGCERACARGVLPTEGERAPTALARYWPRAGGCGRAAACTSWRAPEDAVAALQAGRLRQEHHGHVLAATFSVPRHTGSGPAGGCGRRSWSRRRRRGAGGRAGGTASAGERGPTCSWAGTSHVPRVASREATASSARPQRSTAPAAGGGPRLVLGAKHHAESIARIAESVRASARRAEWLERVNPACGEHVLSE